MEWMSNWESSVGINAQFNSLLAKTTANLLQQSQFVIEVYCSYFQFDAAETLCKLVLYPLVHFLETTHPD